MNCTKCENKIYGYGLASPTTDKENRMLCQDCAQKQFDRLRRTITIEVECQTPMCRNKVNVLHNSIHYGILCGKCMKGCSITTETLLNDIK